MLSEKKLQKEMQSIKTHVYTQNNAISPIGMWLPLENVLKTYQPDNSVLERKLG